MIILNDKHHCKGLLTLTIKYWYSVTITYLLRFRRVSLWTISIYSKQTPVKWKLFYHKYFHQIASGCKFGGRFPKVRIFYPKIRMSIIICVYIMGIVLKNFYKFRIFFSYPGEEIVNLLSAVQNEVSAFSHGREKNSIHHESKKKMSQTLCLVK